MNFAVTAIFKNEAKYLAEWVAFHLIQGAAHFRLYNNDSTDNFRDVLHPFADVVELVDLPGPSKQLEAYGDATLALRGKTRWLAYIDVDEFIVPDAGTVEQTLLRQFNDVPAVGVHWLMFGTSGHGAPPSGLVIENYTYRPDSNFTYEHGNAHVKTIASPAHVVGWAGNPHLTLGFGTVDTLHRPIFSPYPEPITHDALRINHYFTKSVLDWSEKVARGRADCDLKRDPADYLNYTNMSVCDQSAAKFAPAVRAELERRGVVVK